MPKWSTAPPAATMPAGMTSRRSVIAEAPAISRRSQPSARNSRMARSEEHTSELQSLMRISYAVFCLKKKKELKTHTNGLHQAIYIIQTRRARKHHNTNQLRKHHTT